MERVVLAASVYSTNRGRGIEGVSVHASVTLPIGGAVIRELKIQNLPPIPDGLMRRAEKALALFIGGKRFFIDVDPKSITSPTPCLIYAKAPGASGVAKRTVNGISTWADVGTMMTELLPIRFDEAMTYQFLRNPKNWVAA